MKDKRYKSVKNEAKHSFLRKFFDNPLVKVFYRRDLTYTSLDKDKYLAKFQLKQFKKKKQKMIEQAYNQAWQNRNFEIDKFWHRAGYFYGFLGVIFAAYGYVSFTDKCLVSVSNGMRGIQLIQLYLLCLAFLVAIIWLQVIRGSKQWQENWEKHIDYLEDYVSGPVYKMVYCSNSNKLFRNRFYSVSKLNELLAVMAVIVISLSLGYHIYCHFWKGTDPDYKAITAISLTAIFFIILKWGYATGSYYSKTDGFIDRDEKIDFVNPFCPTKKTTDYIKHGT